MIEEDDSFYEENTQDDFIFDEEHENDEVDEFYSYVKERKVNDYITLKLGENDIIDIFMGDELFNQCKYLFLNIHVDRIKDYKEISSIDEGEEFFDNSMEN